VTGLVAARPLAGLLSLLLALFTGVPAMDTIRSQQWHLDFLHIDQAHTISTGKGVTVGVIDTGVDAAHPDLAGSLEPGADFSFEKRADAWEDLDGHGTAMVGLIAAHGQAEGIAPDATILPVRDSVSRLGVDDTVAADAVDWAVNHGATVLCLAFGGPNDDQGLKAAIEYAIAHDVVVVAGVGNTTDGDGLQYPAGYSGVVGVAGVGQDGNHADISVVSSAAVLAAPAVHIMSTESRNAFPSGYGTRTGTSDATAIVAGVAALIRAKYPNMPAIEVIHRMTATAQDRGAPGRDDEYGYGIVDPVAALTANIPPLPTPTTVDTAAPQAEANQPNRLAVIGLIAAATLAAIIILIAAGLVIALRRRNS
jgi:type VII secretion-associated serine protease mycosin